MPWYKRLIMKESHRGDVETNRDAERRLRDRGTEMIYRNLTTTFVNNYTIRIFME